MNLIEEVVKRTFFSHSDKEEKITFKSKTSTEVIERVFDKNTSGGRIGINHFAYGRNLVNRDIVWTICSDKDNSIELLSCDDHGVTPSLSESGYAVNLAKRMPIPFPNKVYRKIAADRDIKPEGGGGDPEIQPSGDGITNTIQKIVNHVKYDSKLVETDLLNDLNEIFSGDAFFTDIVCQIDDRGSWEIYLEEDKKGRIALSQSGSGLKTVISVLAAIILRPAFENHQLSEYVFGFEELENNIHPSLLRKLTNYIYNKSVENDFTVFITTHSNVLIDQFSKQEDAQIVHVYKDRNTSKCRTVQTYIHNNGILDDLDVRASDILQSNGLIWVEGPSDRIYLNRWISLWSNEVLREGTHYQIIFYGGRLLKHLSGEEAHSIEECISMLNINRNAIILIDSDKRSEQSVLNSTKKRLIAEFEKNENMSWVTLGREIENYIPNQSIIDHWGLDQEKMLGQYESLFDFLNLQIQNEGLKQARRKADLAAELTPLMTLDNLRETYDLSSRMSEVCQRICSWNGLRYEM